MGIWHPKRTAGKHREEAIALRSDPQLLVGVLQDQQQRLAARRIENRKTQKILFKLIVAWEFLATVALWVGFGALDLAVLGGVPGDAARVLGLLGALMFTATWAGFLVAGNWFCYWFGHEGGQNTHFQMTLVGDGHHDSACGGLSGEHLWRQNANLGARCDADAL